MPKGSGFKMETYILFFVGSSSYAINTTWVQQVEMVQNITRVPNAALFVEGITYLRGQMVPVVNLRTLFGLDKIDTSIRSRLIVVRLHGRVVGLQVDSAREFIRIQEEQILPPPEDLHGPGVEYLKGIVSLEDRLILVIELDNLLNREEKKALLNSVDDLEKKEVTPGERKSSHV
jgi:purine-binding chemotaxis protein CheW